MCYVLYLLCGLSARPKINLCIMCVPVHSYLHMYSCHLTVVLCCSPLKY